MYVHDALEIALNCVGGNHEPEDEGRGEHQPGGDIKWLHDSSSGRAVSTPARARTTSTTQSRRSQRRIPAPARKPSVACAAPSSKGTAIGTTSSGARLLRAPWATLPADPTSLHRDAFTGRVYAEVRTSPPSIVELRADGRGMRTFQMPPRLRRIAIAPDGFLYHLSVYPAVNWMAGESIVRWALPAQR